MKKLIVCAAALLAAACASTAPDGGPDLPPPAVTPAPDPRVGELVTQMTELLERIDVLNQRLGQLESGAAGFSQPAPQPVVVQQPVQPSSGGLKPAAPQRPQAASPQRALVGANIAEQYRQAIMLYGRGKHTEARNAFEAVFEADPSGDLADNALFWMGETYFAARDYTSAVRFYMRVVNDYSSQNKAPDALLKTALVQVRTGDLALARRTLQQVIERYPYSSSASSAKAELERIRF
ncbi:MAG TPA: tol-pal system protein YbgF [Thermoanaerobaculia bacterium]|nr:tol-pal system protein YbgF [Thermoanaerobaculia bacterium]